MNIETALDERHRAISALRDLYSRAEMFGMSSDDVNDRFRLLLDDLEDCPQWVSEYVRGYRQCLTDNLYRCSLVHGGFVGDKFYSTHAERSDYYGRNGFSPCEYAEEGRVTYRGHYWIKFVDRGAPRHFFVNP